MNQNVFIICVAAIALLAVPVLADNNTATISGGVYSWDTFEPLENVIVEVNSTPSQSMVAKYGVYSFNLEPGNYLITASYYQNSTLINSAEKSIEVKGEGNYNVDLLLLPVYSEEYMISDSSGNIETSSNITQPASNNSAAVNNLDVNDSNANVSVTEGKETNGLFTSSKVYYFLAALALLLFIAGYSIKNRRDSGKNKPENTRIAKNQSGTNKLENSRLLEEKEKYEPERYSVAASTSVFSPKVDKEPYLADPGKLPAKPIETQLPEESELKTEKEKQAEKGQFILETQPITLKQEAEEDRETFAEETCSEEDLEISIKEPVQEPETANMSRPETPVVKKNLPVPADLQEIMDIIRGQGGRITQKDLRSKLKYSEGKVSLMLADLERRELIEKFKRGRGNVIILRDEER
jgi:uncharacterized membrane protein